MSSATVGALVLDVAACSETGRRERNEDALAHGHGATRCFAVLSDGAGGHAHGDVAAALVVGTAQRELQAATAWGAAALRAALLACHAAVNHGQAELQGRDRMHATVVALWIATDARQVHWAHVGDSRLYRLRHGRALQLTRDDSVLQQLVDAGLLSAQEAQVHPGRGQLMAALGTRTPPDIHVNPAACALRDGDVYLLCSDGWWDALDSAALEDSFAQARNARQWLALMAEQVRGRRLAGQDNYSAIAVWVGEPTLVTRPGPL